MKKVACMECDGTGAYKPDCWLCEGEMEVPISEALENGYALGDLETYPDEDVCRCPAYECRGDTCGICEGSGEMEDWRLEHEVTRVLIMAKTDVMPPRLRLYNRRIIRSDDLLAVFAGRVAKERGWIWWFCSIFGDEISLTPDGERERIRAIDAGTPFSAPMPAWWVDMADLEMNMGNMLRRHGRAATVGAMKGEDKA